jgi:hypothetical protein
MRRFVEEAVPPACRVIDNAAGGNLCREIGWGLMVDGSTQS